MTKGKKRLPHPPASEFRLGGSEKEGRQYILDEKKEFSKRDRLPETLRVVQVPIDTRGEQYPHNQFGVFLHRCYAV